MEWIQTSNLAFLKNLEVREWFLWGYILLASSVLATSLILYFSSSQPKFVQVILKSLTPLRFFSGLLAVGFLWLFSVWLNGYGTFTFFTFGFFLFLYVLALIDCVILAVPDSLNFLTMFYVLGGLYGFGVLEASHLVALLCASGAFALLKSFGSFIFKKEIMGEADIVVIGSIACYVGLFPAFYVAFLASLLALLFLALRFMFSSGNVSVLHIKLPFITFLSLAFLGILFYLKQPIWGSFDV